jgi:hypothetical protein
MRDDLSAAGIHARRMLGDAMARVETRLSKRREFREPIAPPDRTPTENLPPPNADSTPEIGRLLAQVAEVCSLLAERIEEDRRERRALTEAIRMLAAPPISAPESQARVVGGVVFESSAIDQATEVDLREHDQDAVNGSPVAPSPNGAAGWSTEVDGDGNDLVQYWLRRESDGEAFPRALDAIDLHFLSDPPASANIETPPATARPVEIGASDLATRAAEWAQPPPPREERDTWSPNDARPTTETPGTGTRSLYFDRVEHSDPRTPTHPKALQILRQDDDATGGDS